MRAAGIALVLPDGRALFLKSAADKRYNGLMWCLPGGKCDEGETELEAALRELREETGWIKPEDLGREPVKVGTGKFYQVDYAVFKLRINSEFVPTLSEEHVGYAWAPLDDPPQPLHPGMKQAIPMLAKDQMPVLATVPNAGVPIGHIEKKAKDEDFNKSLHEKAAAAKQSLKENLRADAERYGIVGKDGDSLDWGADLDDLPVDSKHDGPWMSCMSKDGRTMYRNKNVPQFAEIDGKHADVDGILKHHEGLEWVKLQQLLAEFKQECGREPDDHERAVIYLEAHNTAGVPGERAYFDAQYGPDLWDAWNAWCRGEEAKIEKGPFANEPEDADVKPIPHGHGDLEFTGDAAGDAEQRPIVDLPRDKDGMLIEPDQLTPDVARMIEHNRERAANHWNYADEHGAGNQHSYDEEGNYNCGRCNQAQGDSCLLVDIKRIDRIAGSCEDWEKITLGDAEMRLKRKSPDVANYGVAKNGVGFGCHRCPYARQAKNVDSEGRALWCGEGGFHITPTACCTQNGAETVAIGKDHIGDDVGWKESEHKRDQDGKFSSTSGGGGGKEETSKTAKHEQTKVAGGVRVTASGGPLPDHIRALKIPPAWTDVTFSLDPDADLLATGKDSKGRRQAVYSTKFSARQAAAKFARVDELNRKFDSIFAQNEVARSSDDPKKRAAADCARLIMMTGIRPGSEDDTGAEKRAYGATTLEGRHVVVGEDGAVWLKFVGKKGVDLDIPVTDEGTAQMLIERKQAAGDDGQLFGISEKALLDHVHSFDGGGFKTKDFRTLLGTRSAMDEVAKREPPPKTDKEYRKAVMSVAKVVSARLGNTPTIALQSYINPVVFSEWKIAA